MKYFLLNRVKYLAIFVLSLTLIACGGSGDSGDSSTATLSGTAAVGAALVNKTVSVINSLDVTVTTTTDANGKYTVTVDAGAKPYMLKVETDGEPLFSFALAAGVTNITPLTNLALHEANKNGTTYTGLANLFSSFSANVNQIDETTLKQAIAKVNATLATQLSANNVANTVDFFSQAFNADHTGIDAILDGVDISIGSGGTANDITITISGITAFTFNPDISVTGFLPGSSGSTTTPTGSCAAKTTAYASVSDLFSDIAGTYEVTSITGGGGSEQTAIESYNDVEIIISNTNLNVRACADATDSSTCNSQIQYGGSSSWSGLTSELLDHESNLYFDYSPTSTVNMYYEHATCELTVETRPMSSLTNWAALHHDPAELNNTDGGTGGTLAGSWSLTISGTAGGVNIQNITINDLPAASVPTTSNSGTFAAIFSDSFGAIGTVSNLSHSITSSSDTQVAIHVTATVTLPAQVIQGISIPGIATNYDLTYTYNKQ